MNSLVRKHPYLTFSGVMLSFVLVEVALSPLLTFLADEGLAAVIPLGYLAQAVAFVPPFLAIGAVLGRSSRAPLSTALLFLAIFAGADLLSQFPLAVFAYEASLSSPFWLYLVLYIGKSLSNSAFFLLLTLLGYLFFVKNKACAEEVPSLRGFFSLAPTSARASLLAVFVIVSQELVLFIISFAEHLSEKLFLIDLDDMTDLAISLLFIALCGAIAFCAGRFAARSFGNISKN